MGTLDLTMDFGACKSGPGFEHSALLFTDIVKAEVNKAFPSGGQVTLRGSSSSVDIGVNSFVVDIPLTASLPDWFDANVDVSLGFSVFSQGGRVHATHGFANTKVSFGTASAIVSAGCSSAVAAALEMLSDGFLSGFIGPVIAQRIADRITADVNDKLAGLNQSVPHPPVPYRFYDLTLTEVDGLSYRFCPAHAVTTHPIPPLGGGSDPVHLLG
jgi:hypothetical protein